MVQCFEQLVHVRLDELRVEVVPTASDELVKVGVHQLEHECQTTSRLVVQDLLEGDDVVVG
jgi:hypothetical protein